METIIVYHQVKPDIDCPDGICAAWIVSRFFGGEIKLVGESHQPDYTGYNLPFKAKNKRVILVDFCYPSLILESLSKEASELVILDHHHTRMNDITALQSSILGGYSSEDCGATFAWKYFFPNQPEPWFLIHVLRRDTGKDGYYDGDVPKSEAIAVAMSQRREGLVGQQAFSMFDQLLNEKPEVLIDEGKALLAERDSIVQETLNSYSGEILKLVQNKGIYQVPFLTIKNPAAHKHISWIGATLCRIYTAAEFVAIRTASEPNKVSLRSKSSSLVDCGEIAKCFGGGGHKNAAGFEKLIVLNPEIGVFEISSN
ncbi:MAG: hypothetical protein ACRCT1_07140 [Microcoleaceae cyanobacterium]